MPCCIGWTESCPSSLRFLLSYTILSCYHLIASDRFYHHTWFFSTKTVEYFGELDRNVKKPTDFSYGSYLSFYYGNSIQSITYNTVLWTKQEAVMVARTIFCCASVLNCNTQAESPMPLFRSNQLPISTPPLYCIGHDLDFIIVSPIFVIELTVNIFKKTNFSCWISEFILYALNDKETWKYHEYDN